MVLTFGSITYVVMMLLVLIFAVITTLANNWNYPSDYTKQWQRMVMKTIFCLIIVCAFFASPLELLGLEAIWTADITINYLSVVFWGFIVGVLTIAIRGFIKWFID